MSGNVVKEPEAGQYLVLASIKDKEKHKRTKLLAMV